jgi:Recombinase
LVIDEDGCYNPADFNDGLLLGLKGTMAQAELHLLRGRLLGGKLNKARKGELRFPLPVGLCYDEESHIILDPDQEVQGAVALVFRLFRETGTAFAVVQHFAKAALRFPKRSYGGAWNGKLIWGCLTHGRVLYLLKNPSYAGMYVFGRYQYRRQISPSGEVYKHMRPVPMADWRVSLQEHHEGYISWEEYLKNQKLLEKNRTNGGEMILNGPAREGLYSITPRTTDVRPLWPSDHRPLHRQRRRLSLLSMQLATPRSSVKQKLHELPLRFARCRRCRGSSAGLETG